MMGNCVRYEKLRDPPNQPAKTARVHPRDLLTGIRHDTPSIYRAAFRLSANRALAGTALHGPGRATALGPKQVANREPRRWRPCRQNGQGTGDLQEPGTVATHRQMSQVPRRLEGRVRV